MENMVTDKLTVLIDSAWDVDWTIENPSLNNPQENIPSVCSDFTLPLREVNWKQKSENKLLGVGEEKSNSCVWTDNDVDLLLRAVLKTKQQYACAN